MVSQQPVKQVKRRLLVPPDEDFEETAFALLHPLDAFSVAYSLFRHEFHSY
jgi:hypothetical protein